MDSESTGTPESALRDLISQLDLPYPPRDGDCLVWSPRLVTLLAGAGYNARKVGVLATVAGGVIAYLHTAVLVDEAWIVDVTARQFVLDLPAVWVAPVQDYLAELAHATRVALTTLVPLTADT